MRAEPRRESDVEAYLVARVLEHGGDTRKVGWIGRVGAPDRFVMLPGARAAWVEVKAPGRALGFPANAHERQQHREHERMRALGQPVYVVDDYASVDLMLLAQLALLPRYA